MVDAKGATEIIVGGLDEVKSRGVLVVAGPYCPIAVFHHNGRIYAVDNRCPHMGFPLHRGSVQEGLLTCPWHHARFDLSSGCTFDLWADDVPSFPVEIRNGTVVVVVPQRNLKAIQDHWLRRLRDGIEHQLDLVIAKAVIHLIASGADFREIVRSGAELGLRLRDSWGSGMTILVAMAHLVPLLAPEWQMRALYQGLSHIAGNIAGQPPRRERQPLLGSSASAEEIRHWLHHWTLVRHRDGAERSLLTALDRDWSPLEVTELLFSAVSQRPFADGGHLWDFANKGLELLDLIGWDLAPLVFSSLAAQLVSSRGGEERTDWRHPVDLIPLVREAEAKLSPALEEGAAKESHRLDLNHWLSILLGEDPRAILDSLVEGVRSGIRPSDLSKTVAFAAAMRIARFGENNELGDWITVLHTFSYCNAVHQTVKRFGEEVPASVFRGVLHGAIAVYLDRYLNVPPAPLPGERSSLDQLPAQTDVLAKEILEACDRTGSDQMVARLAARFLNVGGLPEDLIRILAECVLREDADFHTFQMLEAGLRQYHEWNSSDGLPLLLATARYVAAHAPTQRATEQTFKIAWRLHRGEALYESDE
ncbi:MAG: Rieske 2Fe-2S domain-containing protein [Armatimonadetes bacterium]|nr:Rieske 2Fe-2S domain-containing protein [Armatimonadota bacterium]MDW8120687.1 Rieske 2Fe-2S domain-containing protein [Armatimonadota bacterium]